MISQDEGLSWPLAYDVNGHSASGGDVRIPRSDGSIVGPSYVLRPHPSGQYRSFAGHYLRVEADGRRYVVEPWSVRVEGLPRDVEPWGEHSRSWWAKIYLFGDVVEIDGHAITTCSLRFRGDRRDSTVVVISEDTGRTWRYLATVANATAVPDAQEGFNEPCMTRLANGDLMCVSRVGSGPGQQLARTYSRDGGYTWSATDRLPASGVAPSMRRLENDTIALATGRPGLSLWLTTDPRAAVWYPVDILAHHNRSLGPAHHIRAGRGDWYPEVPAYSVSGADQTSAYTSLLELAPNRLLLAYDRAPFGWRPVPAGSQERMRIYLLDIAVRTEMGTVGVT